MDSSDRVLVLGARGLVGSALVRRLRAQGYNNLLAPPRSQVNLLDEEQVDRYFKALQPEFVFLAAARVGGILDNQSKPADFIYQNLKIQNNVIETARKRRVVKMLFLGSSCIYPRDCPQPIKEEYLLSGPLETTNDAYAIAKIAGIKMCQAYRRQHGMNYISVMPTNLYGPNDNFDLHSSHMLPALIRKFHDAKMNQTEVVLWGDGSPKRELLYVDDLADACITAMLHYNSEKPINIGYGKDYTIKEFAKIISQVVGYEGKINWDINKPNGTPRKFLDSQIIKSLGWKPKIDLEEGIRLTYSWFLKNVGAVVS